MLHRFLFLIGRPPGIRDASGVFGDDSSASTGIRRFHFGFDRSSTRFTLFELSAANGSGRRLAILGRRLMPLLDGEQRIQLTPPFRIAVSRDIKEFHR